MNIKGLNKAAVLAALYNASHPQGMGVIQEKHRRDILGDPHMTVEEAQDLLQGDKRPMLYFDYLYGRVLKINLSDDEMRTDLYNRDNGDGAAERVIETLRKEKT